MLSLRCQCLNRIAASANCDSLIIFQYGYSDVKVLLLQKCGLSELILDDLMSEGSTKRVTVGVADDGDAAVLVRKVNGLYVEGQQLYVEDARKKRVSLFGIE